MLRQGQRLLQSRASAAMRLFSTDLQSETVIGDSTFIDSWKKTIPNIDPPKTPSSYMKARPPTPSTIPSKLTVNLVLPYSSVLAGKQVSCLLDCLLLLLPDLLVFGNALLFVMRIWWGWLNVVFGLTGIWCVFAIDWTFRKVIELWGWILSVSKSEISFVLLFVVYIWWGWLNLVFRLIGICCVFARDWTFRKVIELSGWIISVSKW